LKLSRCRHRSPFGHPLRLVLRGGPVETSWTSSGSAG